MLQDSIQTSSLAATTNRTSLAAIRVPHISTGAYRIRSRTEASSTRATGRFHTATQFKGSESKTKSRAAATSYNVARTRSSTPPTSSRTSNGRTPKVTFKRRVHSATSRISSTRSRRRRTRGASTSASISTRTSVSSGLAINNRFCKIQRVPSTQGAHKSNRD